MTILNTIFGSFFGQTRLAAAWAALGPGLIRWRVPLSLVWISMLTVAIALNLALNDGPHDVTVLIGFCLFGQWLIVQLPLWALLQMLPGVTGRGPQRGHFVGINAFTAATILGGVLLVRLNGYGTMDPQQRTK